jgi:threonine/homoserine/homoserine lactone efflux protein
VLATFVQGAVLGLAVAAPVGPVGVLCIRRTLGEGRWVGLACGLGAATADSLYGLVAGLGLSAVARTLTSLGVALRVVGCIYLAILGAATLRAAPAAEAARGAGSRRALAVWAQTTLLTLTNPTTILSFAAMFSALGPVPGVPPLVAGVFLGSAAWWLFLSSAVALLGSRLRPAHLVWINRASGAVLLGFAVWAAWGLVSP